MKYVLDWIFDQSLIASNSITQTDRDIYLKSYDSIDGIRASNGWYQAFARDIEDSKTYNKIKLPVLGIAASGYDMLKQSLASTTANFKMVKIEDSGHFLTAEKPKQMADVMIDFLR
ncbi:MAG: alpha/beta hydrolase [Bacteroidota bacterium]|nr:alpha/beta hydrolase [Bacteroidota bacterium]